jgi:hypothetical protein
MRMRRSGSSARTSAGSSADYEFHDPDYAHAFADLNRDAPAVDEPDLE